MAQTRLFLENSRDEWIFPFPGNSFRYEVDREEIYALKLGLMLRADRKRIVVIDDHLLMRQGLERLLNLGDEFVVCEEAGDAMEGMEMVRELRPDAVILDVSLPGGTDGIELAESLRDEFPEMVVLILSAHEEPEYARRAARASPRSWRSNSHGP